MTLLELLIGLSLAALVMGLATPTLRQASHAGAVRAAAYEILTALAATRAGAVVEGRSASLCPSVAEHCVEAGTLADSWQAFIEVDGRRVPLSSQALPAGVSLKSSRSPLRFSPNAASASTGTLTICDATALVPPRAIVVSQTGRARLVEAAGASCGS